MKERKKYKLICSKYWFRNNPAPWRRIAATVWKQTDQIHELLQQSDLPVGTTQEAAAWPNSFKPFPQHRAQQSYLLLRMEEHCPALATRLQDLKRLTSLCRPKHQGEKATDGCCCTLTLQVAGHSGNSCTESSRLLSDNDSCIWVQLCEWWSVQPN